MEKKYLLKLFILGLTVAGLTAVVLLQWAETGTAAQNQEALLADNAWTGAASSFWNTADANWTNPTVWNNANTDSAIFSGAGTGLITSSGTITLRGMRFDANGYSLQGDALSFAAGSGSGGGSLAAGEIQVANGVSTQIANPISSSVGLTKTGGGALTVSANGIGLGSLAINAGTLTTTGTNLSVSVVNINGGVFRPGNSANNGGFISQLNVSGGTFASSGSGISCSELHLSSGTLTTGCNLASPYPLAATGGTISPGGQGTSGGIVTANRVALNSSTTLHIEIDANGTDSLNSFAYSAFPVNNMHLNGAQLTGALINGFNPAPGQQFHIVGRGGFVPGFGSIIGQFAQGNRVTFSGRRFSITYTNNVVTLTTLAGGTTPFDFDGDGKSDISVFRPSGGEWWYQRSSNNQVSALQFGNSADRIVPADYTGDGKTDIAFFRPSTGEWFVLRSEDNSYYSHHLGISTDIPATGDFDADGKADSAVFRPSTGTWYIKKSSGGTDIISFGQNGDVPTVGDYDFDGKADLAIFRPSLGQWWVNRSTAGVFATPFGAPTDKPVQGDYTGDGKTDIAFFRPGTGEWFILRSENQSYFALRFGQSGDVPAPGDYDGDGIFDFAVFRPSDLNWYISRTTSGVLIQQFGLSTDKPVPSAFVP